MTEAQRLRLKELILKGKDRSDPENAEMATLVEQSKTAGYEYDEVTGEAKDDDSEDEGLSSDEVKALVAESMGSALASIGLDEDGVKALKAAIEGKDTIDAESIKAAVKEVMGDGANLDMEAVQKAIKDNLPKDALTADGVKSLLDDFKKDMIEATRRTSKMVFDVSDSHAPIEHRGGNLTVGQKQLLNLCMMNAPEAALEASDGGHGIQRPKSINEGITDEQVKIAERNGYMHAKAVKTEMIRAGKALTTGGVGSGAELIDTDLSSDLQMRLFLASDLAAQLVSNEVQMPTDPFKFPLSTTRTTFFKGVEGSAPIKSDPGTGNITLDAQKLIGVAEYTYEADEDAIIAILPFLQQNMGDGAAASLEDAFINGDDSGTHQDSDTEAAGATVAQRLFKGFRKLAIAGSLTSSFATGGISAANINGLRKLMVKYGVRPSDLLMIAGVKGYSDIILLPETITVDKAGPNAARILTGVAPSLFGIPIIVSEAVREDLNASGVFDGVTETKGSLLLVHRPSWIVGVRRGFIVETDVDKIAQVNQVIASFRRAFVPMETPSVARAEVALAINYDS